MNKNITNPLIIQFAPPENQPVMKRTAKSLFVPVNTPWAAFKDKILPLVGSSEYDSVMIKVRDEVNRDQKGAMANMALKMNALAGAGTRADKPVFTYETSDKPFYIINPTYDEKKNAPKYAPSDETIIAKYASYGSDAEWQKHQSVIWNRMKDMMPLSRKTDEFNRDHAKQLKDPKRGLQEQDLDKFWSFKPGKSISPALMGDDMIGMPSVEARDYGGYTMNIKHSDGTVHTKPMQVRSLQTADAAGIMIPMANADGYVNKHQVATDLTAFGTVLHFRAEDGRTVAKSQLFDKKTREYNFEFADGSKTHLKVANVAQDDTITLQDAHGCFYVKPKSEILDTLKSRGYQIPEIITSAKPVANGKYVWQAPGTMTGSDNVLKTVSPSKPGFIVAREPKNGETQYNVLVVEGALKGQIVAKYINVTDKNGACFGDRIAGDKGIIVTQVPGVAIVKDAVDIYSKYNIKGTYIAMDADGRENRNVAKGIHSAYDCIKDYCPTKVLSWNPAQKGMDDALLAVAQGKITIDDMELTYGSPDRLFPLDKAQPMLPYNLDGTVSTRPTWQAEYAEDKKIRVEAVAKAQAETAARAEKSASDTWVETPENISNIQNMTVAKAATMADAMAGVLPPEKADGPISPTPDIDETIETEPAQKDEATDAITKWSAATPAMPPLDVPTGYKAEYVYNQAVKESMRKDTPNFASLMRYESRGKWGIVSITDDHMLTDGEQQAHKEALTKSGLDPVGSMRLVSQAFSLDSDFALSNDDLHGLKPADDAPAQ